MSLKAVRRSFLAVMMAGVLWTAFFPSANCGWARISPVLSVVTNSPSGGFQLSVQDDPARLYTLQGSRHFTNWFNLFTTHSPVTPFLLTDPDTSQP